MPTTALGAHETSTTTRRRIRKFMPTCAHSRHLATLLALMALRVKGNRYCFPAACRCQPSWCDLLPLTAQRADGSRTASMLLTPTTSERGEWMRRQWVYHPQRSHRYSTRRTHLPAIQPRPSPSVRPTSSKWHQPASRIRRCRENPVNNAAKIALLASRAELPQEGSRALRFLSMR